MKLRFVIEVEEDDLKVRVAIPPEANTRQRRALRTFRFLGLSMGEAMKAILTKSPQTRPHSREMVGDAADIYAHLAAQADEWEDSIDDENP